MRSTIVLLWALRVSTSLPNSTLLDRPNSQPSSVSWKPSCLSRAICSAVRPLGGTLWQPPRANSARARQIK
ncbi:hypothetical protein D3C87_2163850 [compost metagenome]